VLQVPRRVFFSSSIKKVRRVDQRESQTFGSERIRKWLPSESSWEIAFGSFGYEFIWKKKNPQSKNHPVREAKTLSFSQFLSSFPVFSFHFFFFISFPSLLFPHEQIQQSCERLRSILLLEKCITDVYF
jgi:hypothetical protein